MSLQGRINRLVKTLSDKGFYPGENSAPGKFTPEIIVAIESFRDNAKETYATKVVINAFRVFDGELFRSTEKNCMQITDSIRDGIDTCIEKYYIKAENPTINYGFPQFMNRGSSGIAVRALSEFLLKKDIAAKELQPTAYLNGLLAKTIENLQVITGIHIDGNFGPATQKAFTDIFAVSPSKLLNGGQGFTFAIHPEGQTIVYQHIPEYNSTEKTI